MGGVEGVEEMLCGYDGRQQCDEGGGREEAMSHVGSPCGLVVAGFLGLATAGHRSI
jgi:hypothetical protein